MDIYLKSVGRGGVLLLNATPNTDGLIPEGDLKVYLADGIEANVNFDEQASTYENGLKKLCSQAGCDVDVRDDGAYIYPIKPLGTVSE